MATLGRFIFVLPMVTLLVALPPVLAQAEQNAEGFDITEAGSVSEAVDRIKTILTEQGLDIIAVIDHAANAAGVGLELRPTQLILFSNPPLDTQLIQRSQTTAIDLPQKFLVWQDAAGQIQVRSNSPCYLAERHDFRWRDRLLERLRGVLEQFDSANGLVTIASTRSVADTIAVLRSELEKAGFSLLPVIDHSAIAARVHRRLRPTQLLIFGNPTVGTQLMQNEQAIGIDLPLKFLVWEDHRDRVFITYNDPHFLANRHNVEGLDQLLVNVAQTLSRFATLGANPSGGS